MLKVLAFIVVFASSYGAVEGAGTEGTHRFSHPSMWDPTVTDTLLLQHPIGGLPFFLSWPLILWDGPVMATNPSVGGVRTSPQEPTVELFFEFDRLSNKACEGSQTAGCRQFRKKEGKSVKPRFKYKIDLRPISDAEKLEKVTVLVRLLDYKTKATIKVFNVHQNNRPEESWSYLSVPCIEKTFKELWKMLPEKAPDAKLYQLKVVIKEAQQYVSHSPPFQFVQE